MKNKKSRKGEKGWNAEVNRRWLLRRAAMTGGGMLLAESMLPSSLKAQVPPISGTVSAQQIAPASLSRIRNAYQKIKSTGNYRAAGTGWAASVRDLTPVERVAAVSILEISQRNLGCRDIGGKIGLMFRAAAEARTNTLAEIKSQVIMQATGCFCGDDCGGFFCGGACIKIKDVMLAVDQVGTVLQKTDFANAAKDFAQTSAAMNGAAAAYREIFE